MEPQRPDHTDPEQKPTLMFYGIFGTGVIMTLVPALFAAIFALVIITGVLIAAYAARKSAETGGLLENHLTFIIRTIWIASLFAFFTTIIATVYMMQNIDYTPIYVCMERTLNITQQILLTADTQKLMQIGQQIAQFCMPDFVGANFKVFMNATLIAGAPILAYVLMRFTRGFSRALRGYRMPKPRSWL